MTNQFRFIKSIIILRFCICWSSALCKNQERKKPNIIFIMADDMGWNDVSFHGADQIPTPNIDSLAYNGVILNKHYVLSAGTPSRASLMTGRFPIRMGMQGWSIVAGEPRGLPLNITIMPEYFRKLGYSTNLVGKWNLGYFSENFTPVHRGFDTFYGCYNEFVSYFNHNIAVKIGKDLHRDGLHGLKPVNDTGYFTELVTKEAVRIIKSHNKEKPLFLELAHLAVHSSGAIDALEIPNMLDVDTTFHYIKDLSRRKYAGMVTALDDSVGKVVAALNEVKLLENSIIVFISDNGARTIGNYKNRGSNYPLRGMKGSLFEGAIRGVACIFSPLIKSPFRVSNELMHISDWLPTLYAAVGGKPTDLEGPIDGVNQWPTITQGEPTPREILLVEIDENTNSESAIVKNFKLIKGASEKLDGYYGDPSKHPSYPVYRFDHVRMSLAGSAISHVPGYEHPSLRRTQKIREESSVSCEIKKKPNQCAYFCLFDLQKDPCETKDLSERFLKIAQGIDQIINYFRSYLIPQNLRDIDQCSFPKYFNGYWMPWKRSDDNSKTLISPTTCQEVV